MLGDATGFFCNDICFADVVEKRRLPVVNMTHDDYYWRTFQKHSLHSTRKRLFDHLYGLFDGLSFFF
jgi:hypothetical protein